MSTPAPSTPAPASPAARRARPLRFFGPGWRGTLREFGVVVAGVLVALALNAWWAGRQERAREEAYLYQLLEDTRENERRLDEAIATDSLSTLAAARAVAVFHGTAPPPPADSLVRWVSRAGSVSDFRPLAGTYSALLNTGDLRLVRNDSLRGQLAAYAASLEGSAARLQQLRGAFLESIPTFARAVPFIREIFVGGIRPDAVDIEALRADPDAATAMFTLQANHVNRLSGLRSLRNETRALRRTLEAQPALSDLAE